MIIMIKDHIWRRKLWLWLIFFFLCLSCNSSFKRWALYWKGSVMVFFFFIRRKYRS